MVTFVAIIIAQVTSQRPRPVQHGESKMYYCENSLTHPVIPSIQYSQLVALLPSDDTTFLFMPKESRHSVLSNYYRHHPQTVAPTVTARNWKLAILNCGSLERATN